MLQVKKDDRITSFQDPKLNDGIIVCRVIEAIKPGIVNWDNVNQDAKDYDVRSLHSFCIHKHVLSNGLHSFRDHIDFCTSDTKTCPFLL